MQLNKYYSLTSSLKSHAAICVIAKKYCWALIKATTRLLSNYLIARKLWLLKGVQKSERKKS